MKTALIIGGTSGLGLELARQFKEYHVIVTGRSGCDEFDFEQLDLTDPALGSKVEAILERIKVDCLIYAAGFYQEGRMDELSEDDVKHMIRVGLEAPAIILSHVLRKQPLESYIAITSSSAFTPRLLEPVYSATKGGLTMLAKSVSLDDRVGKTLVAAPGGMATPFWEGHGKDMSEFLDPQFVAKEIIHHLRASYDYREIEILRGQTQARIRDEITRQ